MGVDAEFLSWLETRLIIATDEIREHGPNMSVQIKGLADIVKQAKAAIDTASGAASEMQGAAQRVAGRIQQVKDMTGQLNAADAELAAAIGEMSNGGPPLVGTTGSTQSATTSEPVAISPAPATPSVTPAPAPAPQSLHEATAQVEAQNAQSHVQATADKYIPKPTP